MMRYGFELEAFYMEDCTIGIPPKGCPTDGFPGLIEYRTTGGGDLEQQYLDIWNQHRKGKAFLTHEHTFTTKEKRLLRTREGRKEPVMLSNIYGKEPRELRGKTIASFQINVSDELRPSYKDKDGVYHNAIYKLFDFVPIIRRLDREFQCEIKESNRQPGWYSIKDGCRLEYRSLPNTVFATKLHDVTLLLDRIKKAVEVIE